MPVMARMTDSDGATWSEDGSAGAAAIAVGAAAAISSACPVTRPTTPSAVRPWAAWKRITAASVIGPKLPSGKISAPAARNAN